jgi:RNA polymerase sigma-70 factor (ECF subfamily)
MVENPEHTLQELSERSDDDLIADSVRGDKDAFGVLALRYRSLVIGVAYRICGDAVLSEDVAQETFIRAWTKLHTYRPEGSWKGWLCRIAANLTIDNLRRRKPTTDISELPIEATDVLPETAALQSERAQAVRAALMRLPVHSRTILVLREYELLSYQEIADVLDIPLGTVKSRLSDARRRLKAELEQYLEEQGEV